MSDETKKWPAPADLAIDLVAAGREIDSLQREVAYLRQDKRLWRMDALRNTALVNEVAGLRRKLDATTGERDALREIARTWEEKMLAAEALATSRREALAAVDSWADHDPSCAIPFDKMRECECGFSRIEALVLAAIRARGEPAPQTPPGERETALRWLISHERECDHCCVEVGEMARLALGEPRKS